MDKEKMRHTKEKVLARFGLDENTLKTKLKFKAVIIMCSSFRFLSTI